MQRPSTRESTRGRATLAALLAVFLLGALAACGENEAPPPAPPPPPDDAYARATQFVYEGGVGGGRRQGRTIYRDGHLEFWKSDPATQDGTRVVTERRRLGSAAVSRVFDMARKCDFLGIDKINEAEFGFSMQLHGPDGAHRVAWPKAKEGPPQLEPLHRAIALLGSGPR